RECPRDERERPAIHHVNLARRLAERVTWSRSSHPGGSPWRPGCEDLLVSYETADEPVEALRRLGAANGPFVRAAPPSLRLQGPDKLRRRPCWGFPRGQVGHRSRPAHLSARPGIEWVRSGCVDDSPRANGSAGKSQSSCRALQTAACSGRPHDSY